MAERMGIRTPVSHQLRDDARRPASRASRRSTWPTPTRRSPTGGQRVDGHARAPATTGPVGIDKVDDRRAASRSRRNKRRTKRVLPASVADETVADHATVVSQRHRHRRAASAAFAAGKTGTTENYGDAWFVGFTDS